LGSDILGNPSHPLYLRRRAGCQLLPRFEVKFIFTNFVESASGLSNSSPIEGNEADEQKRNSMKQNSKLEKISNLIRGRGTPSRVVTEIIKGGWENTGWSGKSCTTAAERRGLKRFAASIRRMNLDSGSAMWRIFSGSKVQQLPLP